MHVAVIFEHSRQTVYQLFNSCSSAALASSDRVVNRLGNGRNGDLLSAHPDQIIYCGFDLAFLVPGLNRRKNSDNYCPLISIVDSFI